MFLKNGIEKPQVFGGTFAKTYGFPMKYFQNSQNSQNFQSFQAVDLGNVELGWAGPLAGLAGDWPGRAGLS